MGTKAKDSSLEIGAIVLGGVGLRNGGIGISEVGFGDATINPGWDQGGPVAVVELDGVCAVVVIMVA